MLLLSSLRHLMKVEVTSVCVRGNIEKVGLPWITRSVFPFLYTLTRLSANKLPPKRLLHCFCSTIPKLFNCLLAEMRQDTFRGKGEGSVLAILPTTNGNSIERSQNKPWPFLLQHGRLFSNFLAISEILGVTPPRPQ